MAEQETTAGKEFPCDQCAFKSKSEAGLKSHKRSHDTPATPPAQPLPDGPSRAEFDNLTGLVTEGFKNITETLQGLKEKQDGSGQATTPPAAKPEPDLSDPEDLTPVPPAWSKMVKEELGPDFDCMLNHSDDGTITKFTIVVPQEKSNASDPHWEMYGRDWRTKALKPGEGINGVKSYIELVKTNLRTKPKPSNL